MENVGFSIPNGNFKFYYSENMFRIRIYLIIQFIYENFLMFWKRGCEITTGEEIKKVDGK